MKAQNAPDIIGAEVRFATVFLCFKQDFYLYKV